MYYYCSYYSGRRAISLSRKGDGSRGLFVIVFDDTIYNNVIGYFMPDGRISCYHKNGGLHILTDLEGGMLMDEVTYTYTHHTHHTHHTHIPHIPHTHIYNEVMFILIII